MFSSIFGKEKSFYGTKTCTYYIPAPPTRKNGYQEKEFDHIIDSLNELGFKLIDYKIGTHSSEEKSGMWIVCHVGAYTKEVYETKINLSSPQEVTLGPVDIALDPNIIHD